VGVTLGQYRWLRSRYRQKRYYQFNSETCFMDRTTGNTASTGFDTAHTTRDEIRSVLVHSISWSAVFAGVAIAFAAQLLLNMLGLSIGAATVNVAAGSTPQASTFSTGAGIWWAIASIASAGAGGYAAGRLSGRQDASTTAWHGLTSWAVSTLLPWSCLGRVDIEPRFTYAIRKNKSECAWRCEKQIVN
jgi:hypothetical protein